MLNRYQKHIKKMLAEATLDPYEQERKMDAWHNGTRGANVSSMTDAKLKMNYDICAKKGYGTEAAALKAEGAKRGLSWAVQQATQTQQSQPVVNPFITFTEMDFHQADAQFVKDNASNAQAVIDNAFAANGTIKHLYIALIYAIILQLPEIIESIKQFLFSNVGISIDILKDIINTILADKTIIQRLNTIKAGLTENLTEAVEKHDTLNSKLWNEDHTLKAEVKEKIMQIVEDFCKSLEEDEIKFNLQDVKLVGSNCSYNYNKDSDLDIHLVMETGSLQCPDNLYPLLYSAYRSIYNNKLDIDFYGIPVEIFVETDDTKQLNDQEVKEAFDKNNYKVRAQGDTLIDEISGEAIGWIDEEGNAHYYKETGLTEARVQTALKSNGVYSVMNDTWIKEPVAEDIPEVDKEAFEKELKVWEDEAKELLDTSKKTLTENLFESREEDILKARSIIADQIRGEWDADKGYTKAAADLAELKDIDTKEAQDMMLDIASEEHVHVGELETAYGAFDAKLFDELEDGHNEADEKAEPANALNYDIAEEPVASDLDIKDEKIKEALTETIESDQVEKIENYIERLYDLRKKSIAEDGEYGLGNLVFKEIRNKGYLDNLRDVKFKLKSKDLSLE